jgi:hypothetical protein
MTNARDRVVETLALKHEFYTNLVSSYEDDMIIPSKIATVRFDPTYSLRQGSHPWRPI